MSIDQSRHALVLKPVLVISTRLLCVFINVPKFAGFDLDKMFQNMRV